MSDLAALLLLANISKCRSMKDVRLEFVDWARDDRYQLTLEDNWIRLHMKREDWTQGSHRRRIRGWARALEARSQFLCYLCEVASCEHITGLCSDLQFVFC